MPQLSLIGDRTPTRITWDYSINPLKPDEPGSFVVVVANRRMITDTIEYHPPLNVTYEAVAKALDRSWESYLFGEPGDVSHSVRAVARWWLQESTERDPAYRDSL